MYSTLVLEYSSSMVREKVKLWLSKYQYKIYPPSSIPHPIPHPIPHDPVFGYGKLLLLSRTKYHNINTTQAAREMFNYMTGNTSNVNLNLTVY